MPELGLGRGLELFLVFPPSLPLLFIFHFLLLVCYVIRRLLV